MHLRLQVQLQMKCSGALSVLRKGGYLSGEDPRTTLSAEDPKTAAYFVLADDGRGVAVTDAVLVGEPVGPLFPAEERGAGIQVAEPLGQLAARL